MESHGAGAFRCLGPILGGVSGPAQVRCDQSNGVGHHRFHTDIGKLCHVLSYPENVVCGFGQIFRAVCFYPRSPFLAWSPYLSRIMRNLVHLVAS